MLTFVDRRLTDDEPGQGACSGQGISKHRRENKEIKL